MKVLVAGLVAGLLTTSVATSASGLVDDPFDRARAAAAQVSFRGTVEVRWLDGATEHHEQLTVQSAEGSMLLTGGSGNLVMVSASAERLVQHADGGWNLLWPPARDRVDGPDPGLKYQVSEQDGPPVAGRPTTVVDIRQGPLLREQVFLDRETNLLLQRRQFDATGTTTRVVGFTSLVLDPSTAPPPPAGDPSDRAPEVLTPARLPAPALAPDRLADGYTRVGLFRRDGVVQVLYSDGIYDLSVFERRGALDRHELGSTGGPVTVGKAAGWRYAWPGGQVVLWQAGPSVFTVVSDAPLDQVLAAARALPVPATPRPSAMERLRSLARTLIQPLEG